MKISCVGERMSEPVIELDFFRDLIQQARERLVSGGYLVDLSETPEQICVRYFNTAKRRIAAQPRTVLLSKEFTCPAELQIGFGEIKERPKPGEI
jgi:hypothetical protein